MTVVSSVLALVTELLVICSPFPDMDEAVDEALDFGRVPFCSVALQSPTQLITSEWMGSQ